MREVHILEFGSGLMNTSQYVKKVSARYSSEICPWSSVERKLLTCIVEIIYMDSFNRSLSGERPVMDTPTRELGQRMVRGFAEANHREAVVRSWPRS